MAAGAKKKSTLNQKFSGVNPEVKELLKQMLTFNPNDRPSAKQLLQNKIFDRIREPTNEENAPFKINLELD